MKRVHWFFLALLLLGVWTAVSAQEVPTVLKGKFPIATAVCPVDKHFAMGKGKPNKVPCILFTDGVDENKGWVLIFDKKGQQPQVVIEIDPERQKIVWRKGRKVGS